MDTTEGTTAQRAADNARHTPRRSRASRGLVALNVALALVLGVVTLGPSARAQVEGAERLRGEYALVGGDIPFGDSNAIYVLDGANQELVAIRWTPSTGASGRLEAIGYRDLRADAVKRTGR